MCTSTVHSIDSLRCEVEDVLGIRFEARESSYLGGPYFKATMSTGAEFVILDNTVVDEDDEVVRPEFRRFRTLLEVEAPVRAARVRERLAGIEGLELNLGTVPAPE